MSATTRSRPHGFVVAYDGAHRALTIGLERSLGRRGMRCWGSEALEVLEPHAFEYLSEVLHVGDVFVVVLDGRRLEERETLGLVRAIRWLVQRSSFALELVLVGEAEAGVSRAGVHVVSAGPAGQAMVREVAEKIVARARAVSSRPRTRASRDELLLVDALVKSEGEMFTVYWAEQLTQGLGLARDRVWTGLRRAAGRGWLEVTDLQPLRAGGRMDAMVRLTEAGWKARGEVVLGENRRGETLAEQRYLVDVDGVLAERSAQAERRGIAAREERGVLIE